MRNIALLFLVPVALAVLAVTVRSMLSHGSMAFDSITLAIMAVSSIAGASFPLAMWLLLSKTRCEQVIYLRAFRTDQRAKQLRRLLETALGGRFRLSGIRPPRRRSWWFIHAFAQGWIALRYAGSQYFDLQAEDRNWMARLLASYARTRFVFIDVRDVTPHVENEIRLSYLAMGPERCVFIVDSARDSKDWIAIIHALLGLDESERPTLRLLSYPGDNAVDPHVFVPIARDLIDHLPDRLPEIPEGAVALAKVHVAEKAWRTRFWETDAGMRWSVVALSFAIGVPFFVLAQMTEDLAPPGMPRSIVSIAVSVTQVLFGLFSSFVLLAIFVSYFIVWMRSLNQARFETPFRRQNERTPLWRLSASMVLVLFFLSVVLFGAVSDARRNAPDVSFKAPVIPTRVNWEGFTLTLPATYKPGPTDDKIPALLFFIGDKYACNFTVFERSAMRADVPTDIDKIVDLDLEGLRAAGFVIRVLERAHPVTTGGYAFVDVHSRATNPDGSESAYWTRVATFPDRVLIIKTMALDVADDGAGLKAMFDEAQAVWQRQTDSK